EVKGRYCEYCGSEMPENASHKTVEYVYLEPYYREDSYYIGKTSDRNRQAALLLCLFTGMFGGHYFYVRRYALGLFYLFTLGFFFIGWGIDFARISTGNFTDNKGLPLKDVYVSIKYVYLALLILFGFITLLTIGPEYHTLGIFNGIITVFFGILYFEKRKQEE
ncbi:MAG: TM2 domain-containing protein, partial [Lachnospiraceae bacterium]|nr:TM2 domain-containing protein [Lachnospiraceae bacterium]